MPLFQHVRLAERYDIGIMSTKGMSVTAARHLLDQMCSLHSIPLLVLHDFDKAGFSILGTLRETTRRYRYRNNIKFIDLGLRLADVTALRLDSEPTHDKGGAYTRAENLRKNSATEAEVAFLLENRVELNALPSDQLVEWLEGKLTEHGVKKVIPDGDVLAAYYRAIATGRRVEKIVEEAVAKAKEDEAAVTVPQDLGQAATAYIEQHPEASWDAAIVEIARAAEAETHAAALVGEGGR
jgi:hypothetical protein